MRLIELTMVIRPSEYRDPEVEMGGEDDGIAATIRPAVETTTPVMVNPEHVRNYYARKPHHDGTPRMGTRISFSNSAGMAVTESYDEVTAKIG